MGWIKHVKTISAIVVGVVAVSAAIVLAPAVVNTVQGKPAFQSIVGAPANVEQTVNPSVSGEICQTITQQTTKLSLFDKLVSATEVTGVDGRTKLTLEDGSKITINSSETTTSIGQGKKYTAFIAGDVASAYYSRLISGKTGCGTAESIPPQGADLLGNKVAKISSGISFSAFRDTDNTQISTSNLLSIGQGDSPVIELKMKANTTNAYYGNPFLIDTTKPHGFLVDLTFNGTEFSTSQSDWHLSGCDANPFGKPASIGTSVGVVLVSNSTYNDHVSFICNEPLVSNEYVTKSLTIPKATSGTVNPATGYIMVRTMVADIFENSVTGDKTVGFESNAGTAVKTLEAAVSNYIYYN